MPPNRNILNKRQREAASHLSGPLLIIAGAGAGKTKTIAERIKNLIGNGAAAENILAITFTNKAAMELKERIAALLASDRRLNLPLENTDRPFTSTFHSLGVHILREQGKKTDLPRFFGIFDRADSRRAVKEAIEGTGLNSKQYEPGKILSIISREKGEGVSLARYNAESWGDFGKVIAAVWEQYEQILKKERVLDFDDLLLKTVELLRGDNEVKTHYQRRWSHIHIDEYQDTNKIQYELTKLLADGHKNICVVGDTDQTIYGWRGARIRNLIDFEKDYPNTKVVLLEENYRSTKTILAAANQIISLNEIRVPKNLFTRNKDGGKIGLYAALNESDEARFVAEKSKILIETGVRPEEIALLYRANFQSRALEEAMISENLPYQVIGTRFFERKEIKDVISYLRLALAGESAADLKRALNVPPRGIGKVTILKILGGMDNKLPASMRQKLTNFRATLGRIKKTIKNKSVSETLKTSIKITGIEDWLKSGSEEDKERLENVRELVSLASRYDTYPPGEGMEKFLTDAALAADQDELDEKKKGIKLMTVHASKGLEFDYVFITGLEDGLFPHEGAYEVSGEEDAEEERRLFYVALTRARKQVFLSHASVRTIFGSQNLTSPSEFITDIDDALIEPITDGQPIKIIHF